MIYDSAYLFLTMNLNTAAGYMQHQDNQQFINMVHKFIYHQEMILRLIKR